ncbi:phosphotransferase [Microbacterium sp. ARD32]|uniref:phosphotransferase n=1 Tax=Microbacterium sp. ARD32 TaxID=2962577 RepID=UPI002881D263|nr:phosphotransferase [Microbacterium sp. ARD32]MDT0158504.1 phosphotransferase [Microbacterium sp. ARD32]
MTGAVKTRMQWHDLPREVVAEVERVLGAPVVDAVSQTEGFSPGSADRVVTADGTRAFVKAVPRGRNEGTYDLHRREIEVMRLLPAEVSAPALLGSLVTDEWAVLVLEDVDGRHPGAAGDGADVAAVLDAFATFPRLPEAARASLPSAVDEFAAEQDSWWRIEADAIALPDWAEGNRARLRAAGERVLDAVAGEHLQHYDGRADNVLMDADGRPWIIDWPWASIGARWMDGLFYLLDVRLRGEAIDVEDVLAQHPLFEGVAAADIDAVLAAVTGRFFVKAQLPAPPGLPTLRDFQYREGIAGMEWLRQRWG